jgi:hypothetical protein
LWSWITPVFPSAENPVEALERTRGGRRIARPLVQGDRGAVSPHARQSEQA